MTIWIAKMFAAWLFAVAMMPILNGLIGGRTVSLPSWDGFVGIGLVIGLPMLLFAIVPGLPLAWLVARHLPMLAGLLLFPFLLAGAAWLVGALAFPAGWKGAHQVMTAFAFMLGGGWTLLSLFLPASPVSA